MNKLGARHMHEFAIHLRLVPTQKAKLPKSIFDKLGHNPRLNTRDFKAPSAALGKAPKDHRFGPIRVDWTDMERKESVVDKNEGPGKG